jgi:hypothetical protein
MNAPPFGQQKLAELGDLAGNPARLPNRYLAVNSAHRHLCQFKHNHPAGADGMNVSRRVIVRVDPHPVIAQAEHGWHGIYLTPGILFIKRAVALLAIAAPTACEIRTPLTLWTVCDTVRGAGMIGAGSKLHEVATRRGTFPGACGGGGDTAIIAGSAIMAGKPSINSDTELISVARLTRR